jgi:23S rRNA pseudouridine1911/1915/1917 synthase
LPTQNQRVFAGDRVEFTVPEPGPKIVPRNLPLNIVYEDSWIIAVDKPSGQVVHPGNGTGEDTLVHALLAHGSLGGATDSLRPGVIHRLDKGTSGLILFAKTDEAYRAGTKMFTRRRIKKTYHAVVEGIPLVQSGTIDVNVGRHRWLRTQMTVLREAGRSAVTRWYVEEAFATCSCARLVCEPLTGRTHQIRVHLRHLGHPIVGDSAYGGRYRSHGRLLLHASQLAFHHPITGEFLLLQSPLPSVFYDPLGGKGFPFLK